MELNLSPTLAECLLFKIKLKTLSYDDNIKAAQNSD